MGLPQNLSAAPPRPKHTPEGVDITPGRESIEKAIGSLETDDRGNILGPNKAGPLEDMRRQVIPYLITGGTTFGISPDLRFNFVFPEIRLQHFVANRDGVQTRKPRPGEKQKGPPQLDITQKAHKLQMFSNYPIHTIGYPSDLWRGPAGAQAPSDREIQEKGAHVKTLREWQRLMFRFENMERFNLMQETGGGRGRIDWDRAVDEIRDQVSKPLNEMVGTLEQQKNANRVANETEKKVVAILADLDTILENLGRHRAYYNAAVAAGQDAGSVLDRMAANRARTITKDLPWGDPTADAPDDTKESKKADKTKALQA